MPRDVAFDLAAAGHEVHAVTSRLAYDGAGPGYAAEETVRGVQVHRVWTTRFGRGSLAGRALDYLSFYSLRFFRACCDCCARDDIVVAKTDPPLISVVARAGGGAARRAAGELAAGHVSGDRGALGDAACFRAAGRDRAHEAQLEPAARRCERRARRAHGDRGRAGWCPGARLRVVPNWADGAALRPMAPEASALRREWGLEGKFVVGYSGNLGRVHDCETLLAAARLLAEDRDVVFSFTGGGFHFARLREAGLANVQVRGYVPEDAARRQPRGLRRPPGDAVARLRGTDRAEQVLRRWPRPGAR